MNRNQKFQGTLDSRYMFWNELGKVCFQYDMIYGDNKDLDRRTTSDKVLRDLKWQVIQNMTDIKETFHQ